MPRKKKESPGRTKTMTPKQIEANRQNAKKGGRPKGAVGELERSRQRMRHTLTSRVEQEWADMIDKQFELARGVTVQEENGRDDDGNPRVRVYKKPPSLEALKYLTDQAIGKPKEIKDINLGMQNALTPDDLEAMANGEVLEVDDDEETYEEPEEEEED